MSKEYDNLFSKKLTEDENFDNVFGADEDDKLMSAVEAANGETVAGELDSLGDDIGPDHDTPNKPTDDSSDQTVVANSEDEEIDLVDGAKAKVCPEHINDQTEKFKDTKTFTDGNNRFDEAYNELMSEADEDCKDCEEKKDHEDKSDDIDLDADLDSDDDDSDEEDSDEDSDSSDDIDLDAELDSDDDDSDEEDSDEDDKEDESCHHEDDEEDIVSGQVDSDDIDDTDDVEESAASDTTEDDSDIDIVSGNDNTASKKIIDDLKEEDPDDDVLDDKGDFKY